MSSPPLYCVIPAAGIGQRMQAELPKQYLPLQGVTLLEVTLSRLLTAFPHARFCVALHPQDQWWPACEVRLKNRWPQACIERVEGGAERADSVLAALDHLAQDAPADAWVLVHDAARPCVTQADLQHLWSVASAHPVGALLAAPVSDTIKHAQTQTACVSHTQDRQALWHALTPQIFPLAQLQPALKNALAAGHPVTDESSAMEWAGFAPALVPGRKDNIKITQPEDLALAEFLLNQTSPAEVTQMRIGQGFDVHRFGPGDHLVIGGVRIPYHQGLVAHSDGDVLIHALCDALLGACGQGDIGHHFPDTDPQWAGADSRMLLRAVFQTLQQAGYCLGNADLTLIAQAPKMAPHLAAMRQCLAEDLQCQPAQINIKATTTEELGFTGRKEGIAAQAAVLLLPQ